MAAARELFLGFDVGTQSTKALLVDAAGQVVARAQRAYGLIEGLPPGHLEQHPQNWIDAVAATARELWQQQDPARVRALAVSGQQHGCVLLDRDGEVIRPAKLWCDTSTAAEARELSQRLGRHVPTGFTASKVLWLRRHEPQHAARVASVLLPHDYVNHRLTGRLCCEAGDASGTGWFDPVARRADPAAVAAVDPDLARWLPGLLAAGSPVGPLSAAGAELLGLPTSVEVATGGGDNTMSAIGSGAVAAGVVVVSLGTSGTVFTWSPAPVIDPEGLIAPFCSSDGGWLPLLCVMNLTGVTEEVRALCGLDHGALTAAAERAPRGAGGLLWLPFLAGERVPDLPDATGALLGQRPGSLQPGKLYRAALEGTSLNLASGLERMRRLGVQAAEVRLVGGAAKNPLWQQILADCFGARVRVLAEPESAAFGAALQAHWTWSRRARSLAELTAAAVRLGDPVAPDPAGVAFYRGLRQEFEAAVRHQYGGRGAPA